MDANTVDPRDAWNVAFSQLELQFDRATFDTWLRDATLLRFEDGVFVIGVANSYARDMLEHRLYRNIRRVLSDVCGTAVDLRFEVGKSEEPTARLDGDEMPLFRLLAQQDTDTPTIPLHRQVSRPTQPDPPETELNPRYTFERFVVNGTNHITYEAARAVSERPGVYNPFLVYGGVGLGKTHLLQAIAHAARARALRVIYISSEAFTNDLIDSIRHRTTAMFREKYRSADMLVVDDIQFIAGKDSTQEEFFHTFNALYTFNRQIVLASDRHPSQLAMLEDRLRSRFAGGLVADVQPPDLETRMAIVSMWAAERGIGLPDEICEVIAERASGNIRELEGTFNQIVAKSHLGQLLTVTSAETTIENYHPQTPHATLNEVLEATACIYGFTPQDLAGPRRAQRINQARQVAMFLARELTDASLPQIGEALGGRSHTTILHGCNRVAEGMAADATLCGIVEVIRRKLSE